MEAILFRPLLWAVVGITALISAIHIKPKEWVRIPIDRTQVCALTTYSFMWKVQALLGCMAFVVLFAKRQAEQPRRPAVVWMLDASKQVAGSGAAWACGLLTTWLLTYLSTEREQCGWYLMAYVFDTIGVYFVAMLLQVLEQNAVQRGWTALETTGVYPSEMVYLKQLAAYTVIVAISRALSLVVLLAFMIPVRVFVENLISKFYGRPDSFLLFIMITGPGVLHTTQILVQDVYLKRKEVSEPDEI